MGYKKFNELDVICLTEAFDHDVNDILTVEFHKLGFKHSTDILNAYALFKLKFINGGIRVFSRWPILRSEFRMFPFGGMMDLESYIGKGVLAVRIKPRESDVVHNVLVTHLAAWDNDKGRKEQIDMIDDFVADMKYADIVHNEEPILITGDFNIDAFQRGDDSSYSYLIKRIGSYRVPNSNALKNIEDGVGTYCKSYNSLIGRDGEKRMEINELLDYTLVLKSRGYKLVDYNIQVLKPFLSIKGKGIMYKDVWKRYKNLSDHFPNLTSVEFVL